MAVLCCSRPNNFPSSKIKEHQPPTLYQQQLYQGRFLNLFCDEDESFCFLRPQNQQLRMTAEKLLMNLPSKRHVHLFKRIEKALQSPCAIRCVRSRMHTKTWNGTSCLYMRHRNIEGSRNRFLPMTQRSRGIQQRFKAFNFLFYSVKSDTASASRGRARGASFCLTRVMCIR